MFDYIKATYKAGNRVLVRSPRGVVKGEIAFLSDTVVCIIDEENKRHALRGCDIDYCEDYGQTNECVKENMVQSVASTFNKTINNNTDSVTTNPKTNKRSLTEEEESEVEELVDFFRQKGFSRSCEISNYIREYGLGNRFPHISGYIDLCDGEDSWTFEGGISPKYYAIICQRLGLNNNGSNASVTDFTSYANKK